MDALIQESSPIDVVIPAFNAEHFILQTLQSVALQGNYIRSVIVVNDGSTDNTVQIIEEFAKTHSGVSIRLINQENMGLAHARNTGIKAATAPYIALLDADDLWVASKLEKQLEKFNHWQNASSSKSKLAAVYCGYTLINQHSEPISGKNLVIPPTLRGDVYRQLMTGNFISGSGSSVLIRADIFKTIGYFDESLKASEDWDMWLRVAKEYSFDYVDESLVQIRVHSNNMQKDFSRMLSSELAMLNKFAQSGTHNYFLLWKIQTVLFKKKIDARSIVGFETSEPWVKSQLTGLSVYLWGAILFVPNLLWGPIKAMKHLLTNSSKGTTF